jgi:hypothetical protein
MKNIYLRVLRAKIRGLQATGVSIHNRIRKTSGKRRDSLWQEKRRIGTFNREHLIAYGLLRGIPYERIEHCSNVNRPSPARIHELMLAHMPPWEAKKLTVEAVQALLEPTEKRLEK